jgi:hypothetical protein
MRRIILLLTVTALTVALVALSALPVLGQPPRYVCGVALYETKQAKAYERETGQECQKVIVRRV